MLRIVLATIILMAVTTVAVLGYRGMSSTRPPILLFNDMVEQPKYKPQAQSPFFADGRTMRLPPTGAVPWGRATSAPDPALTRSDAQFYALQKIPVLITPALLARGQQVFNTYCAVCHGATGSGNGITTQYGMNNPPSYHSDRLRSVNDGYLYQVVSEGKSTMPAYGPNVPPGDRWAVISYIRALQRANHARRQDVPESRRGSLDQ